MPKLTGLKTLFLEILMISKIFLLILLQHQNYLIQPVHIDNGKHMNNCIQNFELGRRHMPVFSAFVGLRTMSSRETLSVNKVNTNIHMTLRLGKVELIQCIKS